MRLGRDQKGKNKAKEIDDKRMGRDYRREERVKKPAERQKKDKRIDEIIRGRREEKAREIRGTQIVRA